MSLAARRTAPTSPDAIGITLAVSALAWVGVSFSRLSGAWGLDTLRHVPLPLALTLIAALLLSWLPGVAAAVRAVVAALGAACAGRGALPFAALAVLVTALLLAPHDPMLFVGDSSLRLAAITVRGDASTVFPQAAPLDRLVNFDLARALRGALPISDADALQISGALVGGAWAASALGLLRALGLQGAALGAALLVLLFSGVPLHFAGYDKFGPLTLGITLAAAGAVHALRGGRPWWLTTGLVIALLSHRTGLLALPAGLFALVLLATRPGAFRREARVSLGLIVLATAFAVPQALQNLNDIDRARHLSGWSVGRLWDAKQLLWLLTPLWLGGLAAAMAWRALPSRRQQDELAPHVGRLAVLTLLPWLALLLLVRGSQGAARDWDMHVPAASLVALAVAAALGAWWQRTGVVAAGAARTLSVAVVLAAATSITLWTLHGHAGAQSARIADQLGNRAGWSSEAWARAQDFMGVTALRTGRADAAIVHWNAAIEGAPNPRYYYQIALAHLRMGRFGEGREWFLRTQQRDPQNADVWVGRALLASGLDSLSAARGYADSALARQPRKWDALEIRRKLLQSLTP